MCLELWDRFEEEEKKDIKRTYLWDRGSTILDVSPRGGRHHLKNPPLQDLITEPYDLLLLWRVNPSAGTDGWELTEVERLWIRIRFSKTNVSNKNTRLNVLNADVLQVCFHEVPCFSRPETGLATDIWICWESLIFKQPFILIKGAGIYLAVSPNIP